MRILFNPTPDQIAAIENAAAPSGANPFQTGTAVAVSVAAEAAARLAADDAHKVLTTGVHGVGAGDTVEGIVGSQDKADNAEVAATAAAAITTSAVAARGFFLFDTASDLGGGYKMLSRIPSTGAQKTVAVTVNANPTLLGAWATEAAVPGAILLPTHTARARLRLSEAVGDKTATVSVVLYKRTAGGVETVIGVSAASATLAAAEATYDFSLAVVEPAAPLASTDRLVVKAYAIPAGAGADPVVTVYYEGATLLSSTTGIGVACGGWQSGNPAVRYSERRRECVSMWNAGSAPLSTISAVYVNGSNYASFDKANINTAAYDYYVFACAEVVAGMTDAGLQIRHITEALAVTLLTEMPAGDWNLAGGAGLRARQSTAIPAATLNGLAAGKALVQIGIKGDGTRRFYSYDFSIIGVPK